MAFYDNVNDRKQSKRALKGNVVLSESRPTVYIILVNYNSWRDTIECLESILRNEYTDYRIVIVDNNSSDQSFENIMAWSQGSSKHTAIPIESMKKYSYPPVQKPIAVTVINENENVSVHYNDGLITIIRATENRGFSYGNNLGLKYIASIKKPLDLLWLLNNDTVINSDILTSIINFAGKKQGKPFAAGTMVRSYYDPSIVDSAGWGYLHILTAKSSHHKSGLLNHRYIVCSSFFTNVITMMDEGYFLYFEDSDYSMEMTRNNIELCYCPDSIVYHKVNTSTSKVSIVKEIKLQSMVRFYRKHYPVLLFWIAGIRFLFYVISGRMRHLDILLGALKKSQ